MMWALVDPEAPKAKRGFVTLGTGHKFPEAERFHFIGTFQLDEGALIFHLFEYMEMR